MGPDAQYVGGHCQLRRFTVRVIGLMPMVSPAAPEFKKGCTPHICLPVPFDTLGRVLYHRIRCIRGQNPQEVILNLMFVRQRFVNSPGARPGNWTWRPSSLHTTVVCYVVTFILLTRSLLALLHSPLLPPHQEGLFSVDHKGRCGCSFRQPR